MNVGWLVDAPVEALTNGLATSPMASARYRCLLLREPLAAQGVESTVFSTIGDIEPSAILRGLRDRAIACVVAGKPLSPRMVEVARRIQGGGIRVIADFCDDYFDHPEFGPLNLAMAALADRLVVSTPVLAEALSRHSGRRAAIISDPYEGPRGVPRFLPAPERLALLWFGHSINLPTLAPLMPQLDALSRLHPLRLTIVTGPDQIRLPQSPPHFPVNYIGWTLPTLWQNLAASDVVIIPSLKDRHYKAKSPNRLIEALWAGRAVAAHRVPSYADFAPFCSLGEDIAGAIAAMIADPSAIEQRIAAGQAFVARRHAPAVMAEQWVECLRD